MSTVKSTVVVEDSRYSEDRAIRDVISGVVEVLSRNDGAVATGLTLVVKPTRYGNKSHVLRFRLEEAI